MRLTVQGISSIGVFMRFGERMLFNDNEWSVFHDAFSLLYQNSCHLAGLFGVKVVGHLHGFKHDNGVTGLYLVANSNLDFGDDSR